MSAIDPIDELVARSTDHRELRRCLADDIFGTRIEPAPKKRPKHYARRLQWADGTPLESGWRPGTPHAPTRLAKRRRTIRRP